MRRENQDVKMHIALLGDSIFDNSAYVPDEPSVIDQLRSILEKGQTATLLAIDGSTTAEVLEQLKSIPKDATHIIVSSGGNDALQASLTLQVGGTAKEFLEELVTAQDRFRQHYGRLLGECKKIGKPTVVCTIYDCIPSLESWKKTALSIFNDVIIREATTLGFPVIDLRTICYDESDYSSVSRIEPSSRGGMKIAKKIAAIVQTFDFKLPRNIQIFP
ncbi:MAG: SGNH/GDSL hydrolase family protein [Spirochaetia bacterium]|jgi:lysophospholipase L1-like esterase